jgi:hypothetical protein
LTAGSLILSRSEFSSSLNAIPPVVCLYRSTKQAGHIHTVILCDKFLVTETHPPGLTDRVTMGLSLFL